MSYYKKFQILSHSFFWRSYISWAYKRGIEDLAVLGRKPNFDKSNFSCLLCGTSGEVTTDEFIRFVLSKNPKATITIIDYGKEQVEAVKNLVSKKYSQNNIRIKQINALFLKKLFKSELDWIETDGFIEYFDKNSLNKLLKVWYNLLSPTGFITTREFASSGWFGFWVDQIRLWIGKNYLGVTMYKHTKKELETAFTQQGLAFFSGFTPFPTYRRYVLVKK